VRFVTTKAVCLYTVGAKKDEETPYFFSLETIKGIRELREHLAANPEQKSHYEKIAQELNASTTKGTEESFFAFDRSPEEEQALQRLTEMGVNAHQAMFSQGCYNLAVQQLG